jgi:imidazole glycerol-phosphate synthase subunit HisH
MTVIIDYGVGNAGSIKNMLGKLGFDSEISNDFTKINNAHKLILPGVGHFDFGMQKLEEYNLIEILSKRVLTEGVPILGVCLGMQLLTKSSEEGNLSGLGWIDGQTKKFSTDIVGLRIPHMGWNTLSQTRDTTLFANLEAEARFYFVHSYFVECNSEAANQSIATTMYGNEFTSSVRKDNIFGVQFHPEKSHKFGMQIYRNFINFK